MSKTIQWLPKGVTFIPEAVAATDLETRSVTTTGGQTLSYDYLVLAPGLVLDHDAIEGFSLDMVGESGIGGAFRAGGDQLGFQRSRRGD